MVAGFTISPPTPLGEVTKLSTDTFNEIRRYESVLLSRDVNGAIDELELPDSLLELELFTNMTCHSACKYCYLPRLRNVGTESDSPLELEQFKQILEEAHVMGVRELGLVGKEPALDEKTYPLAHFAANRNIKVGMITDGRLLEEQKDQMLENGIGYVNVSIEPKRIYNELGRGSGEVFDKVIRGYHSIKSSLSAAIHVVVTGTHTPQDIVDLYDLMGEGSALHISPMVPHSHQRRVIPSSLVDLSKVVNCLLEKMEERGGSTLWIRLSPPIWNLHSFFVKNYCGDDLYQDNSGRVFHQTNLGNSTRMIVDGDPRPTYGQTRIRITPFGQLLACEDMSKPNWPTHVENVYNNSGDLQAFWSSKGRKGIVKDETIRLYNSIASEAIKTTNRSIFL